MVQRLLDGNTTDRSLREIPGYVAHSGAPLLCASLAKVCGEEGRQEGSKSARQAGLQREEEHEQHLRDCDHMHQVPFLVFQALTHLLHTLGCWNNVVTVVRANRCSRQGKL